MVLEFIASNYLQLILQLLLLNPILSVPQRLVLEVMWPLSVSVAL